MATTKCSRNAEHNKLVAHATKVEEEKVTEATCENGGSYTLKATFENTLYGTNGVVTKENITTTALGHDYGNLVKEVPATCTKEGTKAHYECSVCHKKFIKEGENYVVKTDAELVIAKTSHTMTHHAEVPATCTENGIKEYYSCSECGFNYSDENGTTKLEDLTITAVGHHTYAYGSEPTYNIEEVVEGGQKKYKCTGSIQCSKCDHIETETVYATATQVTAEPTCTTNGSIKLTFRFTKTGAHFPLEKQTTYTLNKLGHSMSHVEAKEATCTTSGNIEYYHCSTCNKNFTDEVGTAEVEGKVTIGTLGHNYKVENLKIKYTYDEENHNYYAPCTRTGCDHKDIQAAGTEQYPYLANDEATLRSAIEKGGYVRLVENVSVSNVISLNPTEHKNTILDLGGNKITGIENSNSSKKLFYINNATFTVRNGHIETPEGWYTFRVNGRKGEDKATKDPNAEIVNTKLILEESLTVTSHGCSVFVWGAGAELVTSATLTNDGEFGTISGNGNTGCDVKSVTILGGQVTHTKEVAIYIPNCKNWNITGGTITGTTAVYIKSGTVVIGKDAKLIATGDKQNYAYNGNGCHSTGEALVIDACGYPGGSPTVTIENGATFETKDATDKAKEIGVYHYNGNTATVTNGTSYNADAVVVNP